MNREWVIALSDEELRSKAAELMGYVGPLGMPLSFGYPPCEGMPNYPKDIAAAWELEETILSGDIALRIRYARVLVEIVRISEICGTTMVYEEARDETALTLCHASPRDRTRAFIVAMTQEEE